MFENRRFSLTDTHCHLDFLQFMEAPGGVRSFIDAAAKEGVFKFITISTHVARTDNYRSLAETHPEVFFTVGTHPHQADEESDVSLETLVELSDHPKCVGIGEAGLDYFYDKGGSPTVQKAVFEKHLEAAALTDLPIVIHARNADEDMIEIIKTYKEKKVRGVLHCFSSGDKLAETGLEHGFYISFSGILTFKKSESLRRLAKEVPLERLLVETDAPYLAPEPFRGKDNQPAYVRRVAEVLADVKQLDVDEIARITTENAQKLFHKMVETFPQ